MQVSRPRLKEASVPNTLQVPLLDSCTIAGCTKPRTKACVRRCAGWGKGGRRKRGEMESTTAHYRIESNGASEPTHSMYTVDDYRLPCAYILCQKYCEFLVANAVPCSCKRAIHDCPIRSKRYPSIRTSAFSSYPVLPSNRSRPRPLDVATGPIHPRLFGTSVTARTATFMGLGWPCGVR